MFDLLLVAILIVCTVGLVARRLISLAARRWVIATAVLLCVIQIAFEDPRIQLLLAYIATAMFALSALIGIVSERIRPPTTPLHASLSSRVSRWLAAGITVIAILVTIVLCIAFPRFEFPKPSGPYALGVHEFRLTDNSRLELKTAAPDDHRQLLIRVTFPAMDTSDTESLPLATVPNIGLAGAIAMLAPRDAVASTVLSWGRVPTHAKVNAPIALAQKTYPVLFFSHGMTGIPEQNTVLVEELASHGYIVMAINHPYLSAYFESLDGTVARRNMNEPVESIAYTPELIAKIRALNAQLFNATTASELTPLIKEREALDPQGTRMAADHTKLMSDDQRFAIDNLRALQSSDSLLAGHLDLERTGVFGMSLGGSASVITCSLDSRCHAGLNMDGWTRSPEPLPPLRVPFMHMNSERSYFGLIPYEQSNSTGYNVRVKGTAHNSYTDAVLAAPQAKHIGMLGPIDGTRMLQLTNEYVLAFFNKHLLGRSAPLLNAPSERYPEVSFAAK